ncbi:AraC family transcriptional regulator [Cytophagaceae bacterium YF14B1]|uniref:AraC family transcriptional regulator n=1 Tax=Xanthocytophaga flava TaxID=3048013 RepID=A0AAE3QZG0_9BACT|nr:AraC family transcriptional regulator [Xanthocytophaga flavus]MDJ1485348.1 AraC family transcriptional regulator [Xanthocytophaga flavus]
MKTEQPVQPFEVLVFEVDDWENPPHKHNFFELLCIQAGSVLQKINEHSREYPKGQLFLLTPQDSHSLYVKGHSKFCFVRFNELFFHEQKNPAEQLLLKEWLQKLEFIFHNHNQYGGPLVKDDNDSMMVCALMSNMLNEYTRKSPYYQDNLRNTLLIILNIIVRNVENEVSAEVINKPSAVVFNKMVNYIHANIHNPDLLTREHLAEQFAISPTYIGEYFKKHTGESIHQHIIQYKLKLVQTRLEFSDLTVSEIAYELAFTDESHLSKLFKKYVGVSPRDYRLQKKAEPEGINL